MLLMGLYLRCTRSLFRFARSRLREDCVILVSSEDEARGYDGHAFELFKDAPFFQQQRRVRWEVDASSCGRKFVCSLENDDLVALLCQCDTSAESSDAGTNDDDRQLIGLRHCDWVCFCNVWSQGDDRQSDVDLVSDSILASIVL